MPLFIRVAYNTLSTPCSIASLKGADICPCFKQQQDTGNVRVLKSSVLGCNIALELTLQQRL
jgi:hypothetical protein